MLTHLYGGSMLLLLWLAHLSAIKAQAEYSLPLPSGSTNASLSPGQVSSEGLPTSDRLSLLPSTTASAEPNSSEWHSPTLGTVSSTWSTFSSPSIPSTVPTTGSGLDSVPGSTTVSSNNEPSRSLSNTTIVPTSSKETAPMYTTTPMGFSSIQITSDFVTTPSLETVQTFANLSETHQSTNRPSSLTASASAVTPPVTTSLLPPSTLNNTSRSWMWRSTSVRSSEHAQSPGTSFGHMTTATDFTPASSSLDSITTPQLTSQSETSMLLVSSSARLTDGNATSATRSSSQTSSAPAPSFPRFSTSRNPSGSTTPLSTTEASPGPAPERTVTVTTLALTSAVITITVSGQALTTGFPGVFPMPTMISVTTVIMGTTTVIPALIGGDITRAIPITNAITTTALLNPSGPQMSSKVTSLSLLWTDVTSALNAWRQDPEVPQQTAALLSVNNFVKEAGLLVAQTSHEDDHDDHGDKGKDTCTRSKSGLPFLGPILNTIKCIANMAAGIADTVQGTVGSTIDISNSVRRTMAQMANILPPVRFMASPELNVPGIDPPGTAPSELGDATTSTRTPSLSDTATTVSEDRSTASDASSGFATSLSASSSGFGTSSLSSSPTSQSTSSSSSSSSSSTRTFACPLPTGTGPMPPNSKDEISQCLAFRVCDGACKACMQSDFGPFQGLAIGAASLNATQAESGPAQLAPDKRTLPTPSNGVDQFMRARFQDASKEQKDDPTDTLRNFIPHGTSSDGRKDLVPSALLRKLDDKKVTMGLINMYGCTSIVVVSKKAIWWSHFWEGPSFGFWEHTARGQFWRDNWIYTPNNERDGDLMPTQFRMDVLDTLWAVGPCSMREPPRNFKGIWCETGGEGLFKPETEPEVMIIAPRKDRFDVALDLYPKVQSNLRYPGHVNAITNTLKDIFKDDPDFGTDRIHTYGYDASDGHDKEADPTNEGGNPFAYTKMNGKFIFQYDPREATVPHQKAAMQLWAELQPKPILEKTWEVPACQAEYQRLLDAVDSDGNSTADFCGCSSSNCTMEIRYCSATCKECLSSDLGNITFDAVVAELPRPSSNPSPDQAFNFLKYELMEAQAEQLRSPSLLTNFLPHGVDSAANTGVPTTVFRDFWTNPVKFGIVNLYGCTSVMVISELAFWASHFWEIPAFRADESATALSPKFQSDVLDWISSTEFCWITLRGQTRSSSLACEVGRGRFSPLWSPQIVILTPKNREKLYSGNLQEPYTAQPGVIDYNRLEYPVEVKKIIDELRGVFQQTEASFLGQVTVVDYKPIRSDPGATPPEIGGSGQYKWAAGKFLLEYDPRAKPGMDGVRNRAAGVDVWAEDRPVPVFSRRWRPWLCQHSLTDPVKRDLSEAEEAPKVCECDVWSCPYSTLSTQTSSSTASSSSNRAGTSTVFVTVQPTPSPTPSFAHGVCRIRIQESTNDERKHTKMHLEIQDNNQRLIYSGDRDDIGRGKTIYISADDHPLGYDISITLDWADNGDWREFGNTLRFGGSSKVDYQATDKRKTPYCDAQDWDYGKFYVIFGLDKHPTRQADCFWTC